MKRKIIIIIFTTLFFLGLLIISFTFFPPTFFTKLIVKKNQAYFVYGENFNDVRNLYFDFIMQRYFTNNFQKKNNNIKNISSKTKKFLVDQEESYFHNHKLKETFYGVSLGQVILLGYGACEGVNGVLGLRLHKNFNKIKLFSLYNKVEKSSPHTLLKYTTNNNDYYIDIWGVNRTHFFSFKNKNKYENEVYQKKYYNFEKILFDNGFVLKTFDLKFYLIRLLNALDKIGFFKNILAILNIQINNKKIVEIKKLDKTFTPPDRKMDTPWLDKKLIKLSNKYIDARFYHIKSEEEKAINLYNQIIESKCEYEFCKLSEILKLKLVNKY